MKIEFILPGHTTKKKAWHLGPVGFSLPSLTLASLAACAPRDVEVRLTDEHVESVRVEGNDADIIGINTRSQTALRAYALADRFRGLGKTVILGGVHASILPEEAGAHADAVVIGEAEGLMEGLIEDHRRGRLRRTYAHAQAPDIRRLPAPRNDLLYRDGLAYAPVDLVMISRGCPHACTFCYLSAHPSSPFRLRDMDAVVREVENLRNRLVFFVDDNLAGRPRYARELFDRLTPLRKIWVGQATLTVADDPALLTSLARSGCKCLFIGFESLSEAGLTGIGKRMNRVHAFREKVRILQDHGILVYGGFILGLDEDRRDVFERTVAFAVDSRLDIAQFHCIDPYPMTQVYRDLLRDHRLVEEKWWLNPSFPKVRYHPRHMSREELREGMLWCYQQFYSGRSIVRRIGLRHAVDPVKGLVFSVSNFKFRNKSVPYIIH